MTFAEFIGGGETGIIGLINTVAVPTIFALAFLTFIWGIVKYFFINVDDEKSRADGRQFVLWGILGMVLLISLWGVVRLLLSTLGIEGGR